MNAYSGKTDLAYAPAPMSPAEPRLDAPVRFARLRAALRWAAEMPRRHAMLAELAVMSDRELADIGLHRNQLGRVFDAGFRRS